MSDDSTPLHERHTVTISDAIKLTGLGRTTLYDPIKRGEIQSVKVGRRRLIVVASLIAHISIASEMERIDAVASPNARRLLKEFVPDGRFEGHRFYLAVEGQADNPAAVLTWSLSDDSWSDGRATVELPVRGKGMVSFLAHYKRIPVTHAAQMLAQRLSIDLNFGSKALPGKRDL